MLPDALDMACSELLGDVAIPMNGYTVPRGHGILVNVPGLGYGIAFDEHPVMSTLRDWKEKQFSEQHVKDAEIIRSEDLGVDLVGLFQGLRKEATIPKFQSLEVMVEWLDNRRFFQVTSRNEVLRVARYFFQDNPGYIGKVMRRWRLEGCQPLRYFAPYAKYLHRVDDINYFSLFCNFVGCGKDRKAHLDVRYLYYLPFCKIFCTNDTNLKKLVPFFLRPDQVFVSMAELELDLKAISSYFSKFSDEEIKAYYSEYGFYPPELENSFTEKMWKKYMRPRQSREGEQYKTSPEEEQRILDEFQKIQEAVSKQQVKI